VQFSTDREAIPSRSTRACSVECRAPSLKSRHYNTGRFPAPAICTRALQITVADGKHPIPSHRPKNHLGCELAPLEAITQTHSDARPIVPHSIIPELRQQRSLQQNHLLRQTVYVGLREDKPAEQVRRE
jgi:hypothetical protein